MTVVTIETLPPREEDWLSLFVMLLMLALAGRFARRRSIQEEAEAPPRLLRIFYTAAMFAGSLTLWLVVEPFAVPGSSDELLPMAAAFAAVILTFVGMVIFGIADFWLGLMRPVRTRGWLVAALLSFGALLVGLVGLVLWLQGSSQSLLDARALQLPVLGAIAGTIWWSYLPPSRSDIARTFD